MSQRDRAVSDQISMLCGASRPVKRLLLLNASSHGDTLNEVVQAYRHNDQSSKGTGLAGCILTKVDEATHPGTLIDTVIRHQLPIYYVSSGQKVPEHLMPGDRSVLIDSVFQAKSRSSLFVPGEADLDEQPAALRHEEKAAAAAAVSDRLRSQCQQLIRALSHNAQELTANAAALADAEIGFEQTRSVWRKLSGSQDSEATIAQALLSQAQADSQLHCSDYVLASSREISLAPEAAAGPRARVTTLLSDRTGLPFAAIHASLPAAGKADAAWGGLAQQGFDKPLVHLLDRLASPESVQAWQSAGLPWLASASAGLGVVLAPSGVPTTLAKLPAGLSFSPAQAVMVRGKTVWLSVAEARVSLRPELQGGSAHAPLLRCVVRRLVDADTGKPLMHSYVLASEDIQASALQLVQWAAWRTSTEPYFKLLGQGLSQFREGQPGDAELSKRALFAAQACATVFLLQQEDAAWAQTARSVLAQLTGRTLRPDRPVPGAALFEGLEKLFVLLDALQTGAETPASQPDLASVRK
jgi:flagellar biosynthesis protein FlhF